MTTALAIINPASGNADPEQVVALLRERVPGLVPRHAPEGGDLVAFVREQLAALRPELVVVSGGDGTISAVATAMDGAAIPLGIIPTGTANLLARELEIPLEPAAACDVVAGERTRAIDAMRIGSRRCLVRLAFGRLAEVGNRTTAEDKQSSQQLAYIASAIPTLFAPETLELELELDGLTARTRGSSVVVTNIDTVGLLGLRWGDHVRPDDGLIDVMVVEASSAIDHLELLWSTLTGEGARSDVTQHLQAHCTITIRAREPFPAVADGEPIRGRCHQIHVEPRSVHVRVPG